MKAWTKIILITALVLFAAGAVIGGVALASSGNIFKEPFTSVTHNIDEEFQHISVDATAADIRILPSRDGKVSVTVEQSDKVTYAVAVANDTLTVTEQDDRAWFDHIGIHLRTQKITVYLPEGTYGNLKLETTHGALRLSASDSTFAAAALHSTSGDMHITATVAGNLTVKATSGDMHIAATVTGNLTVKATSGDVELRNTKAEDLTVSLTSGDLDMTDCRANDLNLSVTSGDVELDQVIGQGKLQVKTGSGDIELSGCDAASIKLSTGAGDVEGTLLSDKLFDVDSGSGRIRVPAGDKQAPLCYVRTGSGDIILRIE